MDPLSVPTYTSDKRELLRKAVGHFDWLGFCTVMDSIKGSRQRAAAAKDVMSFDYVQVRHLDHALSGVEMRPEGDTLLRAAVRWGDPKMFERMIEHAQDMTWTQPHCLEYIRLAASRGRLEIVELALALHKAHFGPVDDLDLPLGAAVEKDNLHVVDRLLEENTCLGATQALYHAIRCRKVFTQSLLSRPGCDPVHALVLLVHNGEQRLAEVFSEKLPIEQCAQIIRQLEIDARVYALEVDVPRLQSRVEQWNLEQATPASDQPAHRPRF